MCSAQSPRQILTDLEARYGFVQPDGALHEVVRDFLRESLRGEERETAARMGQLAGELYRPRWEQETAALATLAERLAEDRWKGLTLDLLNALCWSNESAAIQFLAARAVEALGFQWGFAKTLVKLAREFRDSQNWWSSRSRRRFDAVARAVEGQDREEMAGLDALLREAEDLELDNAQRCLLQTWRARNLLKQGQASKALQVCQEAEKLLPDDVSVRQALAQAFADVGGELGFKRGAAIASPEGKLAYERAVALDPTQPAYHNGLGAMLATLRATDNIQMACSSFSRAIELDPNYATAYTNRGNTYRAQNDYPAALADYNRAIELDPNDASPVYNTACVYALQNNVGQACDWLRRAIRMDRECVELARTDSDFDSIRDEPEFQAVLNEP